jgi:hypothetical protein
LSFLSSGSTSKKVLFFCIHSPIHTGPCFL